MDEIYVGVSGINAVDNPGPGIGVARSLKEDSDLDVKIVGLAYDAMEPGVYMDWVVDRSYMLPCPSGSSSALIDRLLYIKEAYGLDVVIPNLDSELPVFIRYSDELARNGIHTFLPDMERFRLRGKDRLQHIADAIGINLPRTRVVLSREELDAAVEEIGLPVMIKGSFYNAHRAHTAHDAQTHYSSLVAAWGHPVIVQEIVEGNELNVVGLGDGEGESLGMVGMRKVWTTQLGKVWTAVSVRNEQMMDAAERFVRKFQWRGPFELECMICGGQVSLIEVNPRFPAWTYFATGVGVNLPSQLLRRSQGMPLLPANGYEAGKLFVRYSYELVTDIDRFGEAAIRGETSC